MEVLIALILLGVISMIYMQTSRISQKNTGRATDWQDEGIVLEKTIENLRLVHSASRLRTLDSSGWDSSGQTKVRISIKGSAPDPSLCTGFNCDSLAMIRMVAKRTTFPDSIVVSTYLYAKLP